MEKQTVESGWGLECMKGISEGPVVLGRHRRQLLINHKSNQTVYKA